MLAESHIRRRRNDDTLFYEWVVKEAQDLTEAPVLPRRRNPPPQRMVEESDYFSHETLKRLL